MSRVQNRSLGSSRPAAGVLTAQFMVESGRVTGVIDAMVADWALANAQLERAKSGLREIRAFTAACNAAYGPDGRVDPAEFDRLKAEFDRA